jgi:hypothetical protein
MLASLVTGFFRTHSIFVLSHARFFSHFSLSFLIFGLLNFMENTAIESLLDQFLVKRISELMNFIDMVWLSIG